MSTGHPRAVTAAWTVTQLKRNLSRILSPTVAADVLRALDREDAGFARIAEMLMRDPFIAAKVVAMANLIRGPRRAAILSLDRAVQVLGTRHVRTLILSVMLSGPLLTPDPGVPRRRDLWRWVLACGVAGGRIGELTAIGGPDDQDNFDSLGDAVGGLVMGLGCLILYAGLGQDYARLLGATLRPMALVQREEKGLGVNHHQVTLWALESLYCAAELGPLPAALANGADNPLRTRARIIEVLAARIAGLESASAEAWLLDALPQMGIASDRVLGDNLADLRKRLRQMAEALEVDVGDFDHQETERQATLLAAGEAMETLLVDTLSLAESIGDGMAAEAAHAVATVAVERGLDIDPLTELLNRRGWDRRRAELSRQGADVVGLLMLDIDRFKTINDTLGHAGGDQVLKQVAGALRAVRPAALLVARLGGDEFAAVYPTRDAAELTAAASSLSDLIHQAGLAGGQRKVTISAGGLLLGTKRLGNQWDRVYAGADALLYEAKRRGRNQTVIADWTDKEAHD